MADDKNTEDINQIKLALGLLGKDQSTTENLLAKLTDAVEKLRETNLGFMKMIAICEQRHNLHDKAEMEFNNDIKELHTRITAVNSEMHERMIQVEHHISDKIDSLRYDIANSDVSNNDKKKFTSFISEFDRYKWMVVGAALVLGWILARVNIHDFLETVSK